MKVHSAASLDTESTGGPVPTILLYGRDPSLRFTRARVLEGAGFLVKHAHTSTDLDLLFARHRQGLLILCHSLPMEQRTDTLRHLRQRQSGIRSLLVTKSTTQLSPDEPVEEFHNFEGPEALISRAHHLLRHPA